MALQQTGSSAEYSPGERQERATHQPWRQSGLFRGNANARPNRALAIRCGKPCAPSATAPPSRASIMARICSPRRPKGMAIPDAAIRPTRLAPARRGAPELEVDAIGGGRAGRDPVLGHQHWYRSRPPFGEVRAPRRQAGTSSQQGSEGVASCSGDETRENTLDKTAKESRLHVAE